mgnify:CR=1 FL=1
MGQWVVAWNVKTKEAACEYWEGNMGRSTSSPKHSDTTRVMYTWQTSHSKTYTGSSFNTADRLNHFFADRGHLITERDDIPSSFILG